MMKMKNETSHARFSNPLIIALLFILLLVLAFASTVLGAPVPNGQQVEDSLAYEAYTGKILDSETKQPVVFANVMLKGTSIGTVTNADGEFLIKAPAKADIQVLEITHIGYASQEVKLADLEGGRSSIMLTSVTVPIEAVTVSYGDPVELLLKAIDNIPENYSTKPVMLKAFYRETIKQNRNYVGVAEAVLDIYKAEYENTASYDRPLIYKGRKSQDVKKMDTVIVKLQGGPYVSLMLDIAKNPNDLLDREMLGQYKFTYGGTTSVQDRQAIIIKFEPREFVDIPLYRGNIFLDMKNLAFIGLDFLLDERKLDEAANLFIRKKPASMKIDIESANYLVKYRVYDNTWYLSYVRSELNFKCRWERKLFSSRYSLMTEMAVTDVDHENVTKYKYRKTSKMSDILAEQVVQFEDPDFWGVDNIIKPDESIEAAIAKLSRKMRRRL
jgi:hypothetical protein